MNRITVTAGLMLFTVFAHAENTANTNAANSLFQELRQDLFNKQGIGDPLSSRTISQSSRKKKKDFSYFGAKVGVHAFHLKYLGYLFYLGVVAASGYNKNENEQNNQTTGQQDLPEFGEPYANPFQAGFRGAYFFEGKYGFVFDVEYNSFEFNESIGVLQFTSLQYVGVNFIPSFLSKRKFSFGVGVYANFLISSRNNLSLNLSGIKEYVSWIDFGLIASFQFYIDVQLKLFFGLEFKLGFADIRNMPYQSTETNRNMGFYFNMGIGF